MMRSWGIGLIVAVCWCGMTAPIDAAILGFNLVVNGDAEAGLGSATGYTVVGVPGWTTTSNFTVVRYDAGGGFPTLSDPGPASRGDNFFAGGPDTSLSSAFQIVDVSPESALIDAGLAQFDLSGYLGGYLGQSDSAEFSAIFRDGLGGSLGSAAIGPVTREDRSYLTGTIFRNLLGVLPTGTRSVRLELTMRRSDGSYDDGYADNLGFSLSALEDPPGPTGVIPEPATLAVFSLGLVVCGVVRRRRLI